MKRPHLFNSRLPVLWRDALQSPSSLGWMALALATSAVAADPAPAPPAQVIGPRSPVEAYDAPVIRNPATASTIDFPKLIAQPGANDAMQIAPSLQVLTLDFVGSSTEAKPLNGYLTARGNSRVPPERWPALKAALEAVLAKYRGLPLTLGDARFIQQDITETYAAQGFPLMSVVVPPQAIEGGRLRVQINEFSLSAYRVEYGDGKGAYSATAPHRTTSSSLAKRFDPLLAEPVLSKASLDRQVKQLNAGPFRKARVIFEPGKQLGETLAVIQIDESRPWSVQAGYNNHATRAAGTHRYSLAGAWGLLPFENHQLSWNITVGDRLDEFENYSLIYTAPLPWGHTLSVNANYSDTASSTIPGIGSGSTTFQLSTAYQMPLIEGDALSWDFGLIAFYKAFERQSLFGGVVVGTSRFDSVQFVIDNRLGWKEGSATNQFTVATTVSLEGVTGRNTDADFQNFYNSATGKAATTHLVLNYARVQQLAPLLGERLAGWNAETQLSWQITGNTLAGSDNFAIGGAQALRAYPASEVAGDKGWYLIQYLHAKPIEGGALGAAAPWIGRIALSPFFEVGEGRFRNGRSSSIWDLGLQAEVATKQGLSLTASLAFAGKATANTRRGDATFYVGAVWRF